jgi:hypothetical protein
MEGIRKSTFFTGIMSYVQKVQFPNVMSGVIKNEI